MTAVVSWLDPGRTEGVFAKSLANMVAYSTARQILGGIDRVQSGPHVERGRNELVTDFLESPHEWLLQVDSDFAFKHDALELLLDAAAEYEARVLGGLCFSYTKASGPYPTVGYWQDDGRVRWAAAPLPEKPVWCEVTGCAMLMVHRTVFEEVGADPFNRVYLGDKLLGEDISFCKRLRDAKIPVLIEPKVETGHVKQFTWDQESYAEYRQKECDD